VNPVFWLCIALALSCSLCCAVSSVVFQILLCHCARSSCSALSVFPALSSASYFIILPCNAGGLSAGFSPNMLSLNDVNLASGSCLVSLTVCPSPLFDLLNEMPVVGADMLGYRSVLCHCRIILTPELSSK